MIGGRVLDTGALTAYVDRATFISAVVAVAVRDAIALLVPTTALGDAVTARPSGGPVLAELLAQPVVLIAELTVPTAIEVGRTVDRAGGDVTVAHVAHLAHVRGWPVITDRPHTLRRMDRDLVLERV